MARQKAGGDGAFEVVRVDHARHLRPPSVPVDLRRPFRNHQHGGGADRVSRILLLTGTLRWRDILGERGAWDALIWFGVLINLASHLNSMGLIPWFGDQLAAVLGEGHWMSSFLLLSLLYFYSHYLFAGNTTHISSMYAPFLAVSIAVGTPPLLAALVLGFFSNLFSGMTHYGTGPAPVFFGTGYVEMGDWWKLGGLLSVVNILIYFVAGGLWWKVLGVW